MPDQHDHRPLDLDAKLKDHTSEGTEFTNAESRKWGEIGEALRSMPVAASGLHKGVMHEVLRERSPAISRSVGGGFVTSGSLVSGSSRLVAAVASLAALLVAGFLTSNSLDLLPLQTETVRQSGDSSDFLEGVRRTDQSEWQVVVVNVSEQDCARVRSKITESVVSQGLAVESVSSGTSVVSVNSPDVFISTGDTTLEVLKALDAEIQGSAGELTAGLPEQFDRDELLSRFKESMESPTESDRYFGEMLVIHPDSDSLRISAQPIAEAIVKGDSGAMQDSVLESVSSDATVTMIGHANVHRPVLVVLVRKKPVTGPQSKMPDISTRAQLAVI